MSIPHLAGTKIQALRNTHGLSVEQLADRSGCPVELLEQLEQGTLAPPLAPLNKIARALGVRLGTFLDEDNAGAGPVVARDGSARPVSRFPSGDGQRQRNGMEFFALAAGKSDRHIDPFVVVIPPAQTQPFSSHEGEEFLYVLSGELVLDYGKEQYVLNEGDSIYYDSIISHRVTARGASPVRLLSALYAPD
jgi:quercetin dioxygenase-like cupin family protein/DNA-binding XRE family transcriptional regulator